MKVHFLIPVILVIGAAIYLVSWKNKMPNSFHQPLSADTVKTEVPEAFIDLLFAEQSLSEISKMASKGNNSNDTASVWNKFNVADNLIAQNQTPEANQVLQRITEDKNIDSRSVLWSWNALRALGVRPAIPVVAGVILEVPQQGSTEYLAMYADKTARYVNNTSSIGIWETHDTTMLALLTDVFELSQSVVSTGLLKAGRDKSKPGKVRFSFLTSSGILQSERTFEEL